MKQMELLKALDFERLSGTAGEKRGRDVIERHLDKLGVKFVEESFELNMFESGSATITAGNISIPGQPFGLVGEGSWEGKLVLMENLDMLEYYPGSLKGALVMGYFNSIRYFDELVKRQALGFIMITAPYKGTYSFSHRQERVGSASLLPAMTITYDHGAALLPLVGKKIKMSIAQKVTKGKAVNVVADIPGTKKDDTLTWAVGHYDSVAVSHGSLDNAAGCVNLLSLAEHFTANKPLRGLKMCFFSGEELGLLGSTAYVNKHKDEIKERGRLVVNIDLSGDIIGRNFIHVTGTNQLLGYAGAMLREEGLFFKEVLGIYSSDGMPFTVYEIPSINVAREGGSGLFHCHTPGDTCAVASENGLYDTYAAARTILSRILNGVLYPIKREIDDSLRDRIEKYLYGSRLVKPELDWTPKYKK